MCLSAVPTLVLFDVSGFGQLTLACFSFGFCPVLAAHPSLCKKIQKSVPEVECGQLGRGLLPMPESKRSGLFVWCFVVPVQLWAASSVSLHKLPPSPTSSSTLPVLFPPRRYWEMREMPSWPSGTSSRPSGEQEKGISTTIFLPWSLHRKTPSADLRYQLCLWSSFRE